MHRILNNELIPPGSKIEANGSVVAIDQTGAAYEVGRVITQGNQAIYQKSPSPKFLGQTTVQPQPYQTTVQPQPYQTTVQPQPYQATVQPQVSYGGYSHPTAQRRASSNPVSVAGGTSRRSSRRSSEPVAETKIHDYPTISRDAVTGFVKSKTAFKYDEVMSKLSHFDNALVDVIKPSEATMSKNFFDNIISSKSNLYLSESSRLDKWLMDTLNEAGSKYGVVLHSADAVIELRDARHGNEMLEEIWDVFLKSIHVSDDKIELRDVYTMAISTTAGFVKELHDIRSINEVEIPADSFVSRLVAENNPSKICTGTFIFDVIDGTHVRINRRL